MRALMTNASSAGRRHPLIAIARCTARGGLVFRVFVLVSALTVSLQSVAAAPSSEGRLSKDFVPPHDGSWDIECHCAVAAGGQEACESTLLNAAAGRDTHAWRQTVFGKKGWKVDLSAACHRKREEKGHGEGFCCAGDDAATARRLFAAKVLAEVTKPARP